MSARPILFSGPMVQAILDGRKTQTRRIVKPQPAHSCRYEINGAGTHALHLFGEGAAMVFVPPTPRSYDHRLSCPYGVSGDRLWVRETWATSQDYNHVPLRDAGFYDRDPIWYRADRGDDRPGRGVWRASIHMPRWAARLMLEISAVSVQRLQDISEQGAQAEGVVPFFTEFKHAGREQRLTNGELAADAEHRASFAVLWDSINGERALWATNPWVWVITFKRAA